jgi:hypothetical protein
MSQMSRIEQSDCHRVILVSPMAYFLLLILQIVPKRITTKRLLSKVQNCRSREELHDLLGKPKYIMKGNGFSFDGVQPDVVEVYCKMGTVFDVCFFRNDFKVLTYDLLPVTKVVWKESTVRDE